MEQMCINRVELAHNRQVNGDTFLYNEATGQKCCIGIYLENTGLDLEKMNRIGTPGTLIKTYPKLLTEISPWLINLIQLDFTSSGIVVTLMQINDSSYSHDRREEKLIELFATQNVNVTFTGIYNCKCVE